MQLKHWRLLLINTMLIKIKFQVSLGADWNKNVN